jgi:hypothetical protein
VKPCSNHNLIVSAALLTFRLPQPLASKVRLQIEKAGSDRLEELLEDSRDFILHQTPLKRQLSSHFPDEFGIPVHMATLRGCMVTVI